MSGLALTKYCCEFDNLNCILANVVKCGVILQILLVKCGSGDADVLPMNIYMILSAYMQNRVPNSQRYLVNAIPGTNHSTNPTNPNGNSKR